MVDVLELRIIAERAAERRALLSIDPATMLELLDMLGDQERPTGCDDPETHEDEPS